MKQYTLITRLPRSATVNFNHSSESVTHVSDLNKGAKRSPFEDLLEFNPDTNNIDSLLQKNILDPEEIKDITIRYSESIQKRSPLIGSDDDDSEE